MLSAESYKDRFSTIDKKGERVWVYPKKPSGPLYYRRTLVAWACILLLVVVPFIRIKGHPLLMLNILERKFIVFGTVFWPQDFFVFLLAMLAVFVSIILFTALFGRIWCGWVCPQTVFMEMVFRKIDHWVEGDHREQKILASKPWNFDKIVKKSIKHFLYLFVSSMIGHLVMAYMVGTDKLILWLKSGVAENPTYLFFTWGFVLLFYLIFSKLRELACTIVCPYGRLQSVLTSSSTLNVIYDYIRGEPRGKLNKNNLKATGDCVDCGLCVKVCPTNIDIRNGTQLECINCTACIDACNEMMEKMNRPKGLIRFDSEKGVSEGQKWKFSTRTVFYTVILGLVLSTMIGFVYLRRNIHVKLLRLPGATFQVLKNGKIRNIYQLQVSNKSFEEVIINISLPVKDADVMIVGGKWKVEPESKSNGVFMVDLPAEELNKSYLEIEPIISINGKPFEEMKSKFIMPKIIK